MNNLNGSEKQVAWATDIRKEFIEKTKADMKSADKNDVLDMKAMLKVADNRWNGVRMPYCGKQTAHV